MRKIALVGNPNSGKSTVFNQLTGLRQKVANFPGVTVERKVGIWTLAEGERIGLVDLPGAYSLYPNSMDERIVLNILTNPLDEDHPDAVLYIADIQYLDKHFLLLTQLLDLGIPCLLVLNMADVAEKEGLTVDTRLLSDRLGIPVVSLSARMGTHLDILELATRKLLDSPSAPLAPFYRLSSAERQLTEKIREATGESVPYRALLKAHHGKLLNCWRSADEPEQVQAIREAEQFQSVRLQIEETMRRYEQFEPLLRDAVRRKRETRSLTDRLDSILTHRVLAPVIFFVTMFFVFQAIYSWATVPMDWIEAAIASLGNWLGSVLPAGWFSSLLTDGILAGLGGILVFIPQIAILFLLIGLLEEVGYMARAAFIFDRLMQPFGLNGRSVVALVSGGACAIPAILSTRTIGNGKERLITILVTPFISCSARIPVYTVLIGFVVPQTSLGPFNLQGIAFMGLYLLGIVAALAAAWMLRWILRSEESSWLMLQLPPYRRPVWRNVWLTIYEKVSAFVLEAGKVILLISIVLWGIASYGPPDAMEAAARSAQEAARDKGLDDTATEDLVAAYRLEASFAGHAGKWMEPVLKPIGLDWKIGIALLTSFAAREVFVGTMATIYSIGSRADEETVRQKLASARHPETGLPVYTPAVALSLLLFYVFALQCMSTMAVVRRETGSWKWPLLQFGWMTATAYLASFLAFHALQNT
ncbi:MAG: hypothetical protein RLY31_885 [Bacteroidota bacterium]|jgi:ferrous iron transport protein B